MITMLCSLGRAQVSKMCASVEPKRREVFLNSHQMLRILLPLFMHGISMMLSVSGAKLQSTWHKAGVICSLNCTTFLPCSYQSSWLTHVHLCGTGLKNGKREFVKSQVSSPECEAALMYGIEGLLAYHCMMRIAILSFTVPDKSRHTTNKNSGYHDQCQKIGLQIMPSWETHAGTKNLYSYLNFKWLYMVIWHYSLWNPH